MKYSELLKNGIIDENPVFVKLIALCPLLAVTTSATNAAAMGLCTTAVMICACAAISFLRKLIINEVRSGTLQKREGFTSLTFMGIAHAMIEDTLIMIALGASMVGIFWGRLFVAFLVMLILARILRHFPATAEKARATPVGGTSL